MGVVHQLTQDCIDILQERARACPQPVVMPIPGWRTAPVSVLRDGQGYAGFWREEDAWEAVAAWRASDWPGIGPHTFVEVIVNERA